MKIKYKHKYNLEHTIPLTCITILGILGFISINPNVHLSTYADGGNDNGYVVYDVDNSATTYDLTEDGVVLEWDNRDSDYQTITGTNSEVLYRYNRFRVTAENIKKYQILANIADTANGTNGNKLTGYTNSEYNIPNGYSIDSISDTNGIVGKDLTSSTTSQWGYAITIGEVTTTDNLSNLTYKAVPSAASSDIGLTDNVTALNNQAFTIAFAANIADDKPAGSYRASVGVSIVVEPKEVLKTWDQLEYMQDMNPEACASQPTPALGETNVPTKILIDSRDGNRYTIAKLKDGHCWMTENLRIVGKRELNSNDTDLISSIILPQPVSISTADNPKQFFVYDRYDFKMYGPVTATVFYNWYTATAGTGNASLTQGNAPSSICPKKWKIPTNDNWSAMLNNLDTTSITSLPYRFSYSGYVALSEHQLTNTNGRTWSSTAFNADEAYMMNFYNFNTNIDSTFYNERSLGLPVRCVAR